MLWPAGLVAMRGLYPLPAYHGRVALHIRKLGRSVARTLEELVVILESFTVLLFWHEMCVIVQHVGILIKTLLTASLHFLVLPVRLSRLPSLSMIVLLWLLWVF